MKRKSFLKGILILPLFSFKEVVPKEKHLIQKKEFNTKNITQKIAAEIMALVAWNHLREDRFANSFVITQEYQHINRDGPGTRTSSIGGEGFIREEHGVTLYSPTTKQYVRIWPDGDWKCYYKTNEIPSEYKYIIEGKNGYRREETQRDTGHGLNQVKLISLYIQLGFYKYE